MTAISGVVVAASDFFFLSFPSPSFIFPNQFLRFDFIAKQFAIYMTINQDGGMG